MEPGSRHQPVTFTNVSKEAGLDSTTGNFFSWGDFDNDGHQDLLVDGRTLFWNTGPPDFRFQDVTSKAGIGRPMNSGVFADFDNDGRLDIFCGGGVGSSDHPTYPDILWRNSGDGTFEDVTSAIGGLSDTFPTVAAGWCDVDRNGFVDIYLVNYENGTYQGYPDHFWYNMGPEGFVNATGLSGMGEASHPYQGRGVSWSDFDNDNFPDAYISNYRIMRNYLYRNLGDSTMAEVAQEKGVEGHGNDHPVTREGPYYGHSLGSSWGDLDNDGDMDLWVTNLAHKDPWRGPICDDSYLFENLGPEQDWTFVDIREQSGIPVKEIPGTLGGGDELMVSSSLADYDNDGDLDLFIPQIYGDISYAYSYLYSNNGDMTFQDVGAEAGVRVWNTYGSAWCDYNEDGWMDLVTGGGTWDEQAQSTGNYMVHLFRNDGMSKDTGNGWLEVDLEGKASNRAAIGARVEVRLDRDGDGTTDSRMMREVQGGTAAHGQQDSMRVHFGLGDKVGNIDARVIWPMGREQTIRAVAPNSVLGITEPDDPIEISLSIRSVEQVGRDSVMTLEMDNPSTYPITVMEIEAHAIGPDRSMSKVETLRQRIGGQTTGSMMMTFEGMNASTGNRFEADVLRAYPPLSGKLSDSIVVREGENIPPMAILRGPGTAYEGDGVVFMGSGSYDPDGTVMLYMFDTGDGISSGWQENTTFEYVYRSSGIFRASLEVQDEDGAICNEPSTFEITILGRSPQKPIAEILSIEPLVSHFGEVVEFKGGGQAAEGKRIEDHEWSSSLEGLLSRRAAFSTDELLPGNHVISFRVRDSDGAWSDPVSRELEVRIPEPPELWVRMDPLDGQGPFHGTLLVKGTSGPEEAVEWVELRIDEGPWERTSTAPDWLAYLDLERLEDGEHSLQVRAYGGGVYSGIENITFTVEKERGASQPPQEEKGGEVDVEVIAIFAFLVSLLLLPVAYSAMRAVARSREEQRSSDEGTEHG